MKRMIKFVLLLGVLVMVCTSVLGITYAADEPLQAYQDELDEINEELGTNYKILSEQELEETEMTYDELVAFYNGMTVDEFEDYILELHATNIKDAEFYSQLTYESSSTNSMARGSTLCVNNFCYQSGSSNGLIALTYNIDIGGTSYYQSVLKTDYTGYTYPYYVPTGLSYTPSSDSTKLTCTFTCEKYLSATIKDATLYKLTTTFTASGGGTVSGNTFSASGVVNDDGVRLRNYPNTSSSILELMYSSETVSIDTANSTMTFYRVKRQSTGTVGYVSKDYVSLTQYAR